MKDFSKTHLTFLVLFLILGLGGGYFWYWSVGYLEAKVEAKKGLESKKALVERKGLPPTPAVLSKLQENEKAFNELSSKSLEELRENVGLFDPVVVKQELGKIPQGLPSDAWKKLMNEKRVALDKLSQKNKVDVPKDSYYGFKRYQVPNPQDQFTGQLGIQLLGLTEISTILMDARVNQFKSAKRVFVEDVKATPGGNNDESIDAGILAGPENLYQVYPFEVVFRCSTVELRDVINRLNQSKYFFVIRFMMVDNEKANVKSKSAIQTEVAAEAIRKGSLIVSVAGDELLQVRMRIDMLVWSKQALEVKGAAK